MLKVKYKIGVVLDNIRSALNVGAFFRTSDATGVEKLYLTGITPYPPHNRIPKTALGAMETVQWIYKKNTIEMINLIKSERPNSQIVAVEQTEESVNYWDHKFTDDTILVFGHEIDGVSKDFLSVSDAKVSIPMFGKKESLNVAVSYGIIIYEILRQLKNGI